MDRLYRRRSVKALTYFVIAALILPYCSFLATPRAEAQATEGRVLTIALLPLTNKSRKYPGEARGRAATDAIAIALEASERYQVVPVREVEAALQGQGLRLPLDEVGMTRVGRALGVDGVMRGWVTRMEVNPKANNATVAMRIELLDVEAETILNGGAAERTTVARPGITVTDDELINEGLREAAQRVVDDMITRRIVQGTVLIINEVGESTINLGTQEGIEVGQTLLVLRPEYRPDTKEIVKRKIGTLRIVEVDPHQCTAVRHTGPGARREDFVRVMYEPPKVARETRAKKTRKKSLRLIVALGVAAAVFALATGRHRNTRAAGGTVFLSQFRDGEVPSVRMVIKNPAIPRKEEIAGRVIHRGEFNRYFPVDFIGGTTIRDVIGGPGHPGGNELIWEDNPNDPRMVPPGAPTPYSWDNEIDYFDPEAPGFTTISFDVDFTITPVVPGRTYFYRLQNLTAPQPPPNIEIPRGAFGRRSRLAQLRQPNSPPEPASVSPPSKPFGPVTFFLPPVLQSPAGGFTGADPQSIEFVWNASDGADEYVLEVFQGFSTTGPRIFSRTLRATGQTQFRELVDFSPDLPGETVFTWRVGARKIGDELPRRGANVGSKIGWIFSEDRNFITAPAPPPPPT